MNLWNPITFFVSFIMSGAVAFIFGIPNGLSVEMWFYMWPVRWLVAYLMVVTFVDDTSFKLAMKVFGFRPGIDSIDGLWNPIAFFMSFMMSMLMPAIFNGIIIGWEIEAFFVDGPFHFTHFLLEAALVAAGELVVVLVCGTPLAVLIEKKGLLEKMKLK